MACRFRTLAVAIAASVIALALGRARAYESHLHHVFADVKRPLAGVQDPITPANAGAILDGLKANLHCDGVRVPIDLSIAQPAAYPQLHKDFVAGARARGLAIYANPLGTGKHGLTMDEHAALVADYANCFRPEFLGPLNESHLSPSQIADVVARVKARLAYSPKLVGPDRMHVRDTIQALQAAPGEAALFDIIGSHDAAHDDGATPWAWWKLRQLAGRETWATECPRAWSQANKDGVEIGVKAVVDTAGPIDGLVIYLAYPRCVNADGSLTQIGRDIANGVGSP